MRRGRAPRVVERYMMVDLCYSYKRLIWESNYRDLEFRTLITGPYSIHRE